MHEHRKPVVLALFAAALSTMACTSTIEAPAAPAMPGHWTVVSDVSFEAADIEPVAASLGAEVVALRNTDYDVGGGRRVRLNTIVTATAADAAAVVAAMAEVKPAEFAVRRDLIVYEFVGADDVIGEIRAARAMLVPSGG